ncbi:hypothetical protein ACR2R6_00810 [Methylocaldum gracile subsp. desertum]|uniref:hypothetical protein n=1 Tax=Methylocaldum sp. GT1BW TaxID=3438964 RepID=UPI003D9FDD57
MKRSEIRGGRSADHPGFRKLHPGYVGYTGTRESVGNPSQSQTVALVATLPIANGLAGSAGHALPEDAVCDWKGRPGAPGMTVCDWSAEAALPDTTSRPSVFVGKGLPTYEGLNQFTPAEGANHFRRACFVVRTRRKRSKRRHGCMTENRRWGLSLSKCRNSPPWL